MVNKLNILQMSFGSVRILCVFVWFGFFIGWCKYIKEYNMMIFYGGTVFAFGPFFTKTPTFCVLSVKYPLLVSLQEMWIINWINHD